MLNQAPLRLPGAVSRRRGGWRPVAIATLLFAPSLLASIYLVAIAAPQFASEASFVVRSASRPHATGGLSSLLASVGVSQTHNHAFTVQDYMLSRDAVRELEAGAGLRAAYDRPTGDPWFRFPSPLGHDTNEHLWRQYQRMTEVAFKSITGITTMQVRAFDAADAQRIAHALLAIAEETVNRINARILDDAVRVAAAEVRRSEERVAAAQAALSEFRGRELSLDPARGAVIAVELIGRLNAELALARAQLMELQASSPTSPGLASVRGRIDAMSAQIAEERRRVTAGGEGLARQLSEYDRLMLDREYANRVLVASLQSLQSARLEGQRQQLFLERVTEPNRPDYAAYPQVLRWSATLLTLNAIAVMIGWLLFAGMREHRRGLELRRRT